MRLYQGERERETEVPYLYVLGLRLFRVPRQLHRLVKLVIGSASFITMVPPLTPNTHIYTVNWINKDDPCQYGLNRAFDLVTCRDLGH